MKVKKFGLNGESSGELELPEVFEEHARPDLIKRAVLSAQSSRIQPAGSDQRAGMRTTAETPEKGTGRPRVRRVKGRGYHAAGRGAWAPQTSGGRRAHSLKSEETVKERVNRKESSLAVRSAVAATMLKNLVESRGHIVDGIDNFPIVVDDEIEDIGKTREVKSLLEELGVWEDVERVKKKKSIRSGKGKARNRKYKKGVGPLFVVSGDSKLFLGARNLPGVEVRSVDDLSAEDLAPGGDPARLTIWSESAIEKINRRFSD